jgi:hypothetical protein
MLKKDILSTELFVGRNPPDFIKTHALFKNPIRVQKVFPSIGMPNFRDKANIDKCLVDVKKEGGYVHNMLQCMSSIMAGARDSVAYQADKFQYLDVKEVREKARGKLNELYNLSTVMSSLTTYMDPFNKDVMESAIQTKDGKITLRLIKDIPNPNGASTPMFREGEGLFKIYNKVKDMCAEAAVVIAPLDQHDAYKTFSKENIPNKEFSVVFSSNGPEGAWDIITMSMRGIKSCQRWDGEYPRCLIGSVFSKFVGVIYLTSGVQSDNYKGQNGVDWTNLGTKMMRRCVVRYAVDADENKPCLLIDKMYPDLDRDVLGIFVNAIKSRTEIPVYYAIDLGNKLKHLYVPSEEVRKEVSDRDWSYQDSPLKSKDDLNVFILANNKEEIERDVAVFKANLSLHLATSLDDVFNNNVSVDPEIKKTIKNIRMNTPFITFCTALVNAVLNYYRAPVSLGFLSSRKYYRKYLMEFLSKRKAITTSCQGNLNNLYTQWSSRTIDNTAFTAYIFSLINAFTKTEIKKLIVSSGYALTPRTNNEASIASK